MCPTIGDGTRTDLKVVSLTCSEKLASLLIKVRCHYGELTNSSFFPTVIFQVFILISHIFWSIIFSVLFKVQLELRGVSLRPLSRSYTDLWPVTCSARWKVETIDYIECCSTPVRQCTRLGQEHVHVLGLGLSTIGMLCENLNFPAKFYCL